MSNKPQWQPIDGLRGWQIGQYRGPRGVTWYGRRFDGKNARGHPVYQERRLPQVTTEAQAVAAVRQWKQAHDASAADAAVWGRPADATGSQGQIDLARSMPHGAWADKATQPLTVAHVLQEYLRVHDGAPTRSMLMNHVILHRIAERPVAALTRSDLEAWQRHGLPAVNGDAAKRTRNRVWAQFKAALNLAHRDHPQLVPSDRAWRGLSPMKVALGRRRALSDDEVTRLLTATSGAFRQLVVSLLFTGARSAGELAPCTVGDFDQRRRTLVVHGSKGTGDRVVNLTPDAAVWFQALANSRKPDDVLVPNEAGGQWATWRAAQLMRQARKRAGIRANAVLYCARHFVATQAIYNGRPDLLTARQLGTSPQMLAKTYVEALAGRTQDIVDQTAPRFRVPGDGQETS